MSAINNCSCILSSLYCLEKEITKRKKNNSITISLKNGGNF